MTVIYETPTISFPYKITRRLNLLSSPQKPKIDCNLGVPAVSNTGVRKSALRGVASERIIEASRPYVSKLLHLKHAYKHRFSPSRISRVNRMIEQSNNTLYARLANCVVTLRKPSSDTKNKRRAWTENEWRKHMEYIGHISSPKPVFVPKPEKRGPSKPLSELLPRIEKLSHLSSNKVYKRLSEQSWYKDPAKVAPSALKYVITERMKQLAEPKKLPEE